MKILITSGGTKIPIDMVRSITNMSKGTFGSRIADSLLAYPETEIIFMHARESRLPGILEPFRSGFTWGRLFNWLWAKAMFDGDIKDRIQLVPYTTFDEYEEKLFSTISAVKPDVIILACAASDYGVDNYVDGKIRSTDDEMTIRLKKLPKLISRVRERAPNAFIVGFKLLVNSWPEELQNACLESMKANRLSMIVGNDLAEIKNDDHTLTIGQWTHDGNIEFNIYRSRQFSNRTHGLSNIIADKCVHAGRDIVCDRILNKGKIVQ
jgi:phosphopantothenate-cysteine ligase